VAAPAVAGGEEVVTDHQREGERAARLDLVWSRQIAPNSSRR
jgi:hypothetical protein